MLVTRKSVITGMARSKELNITPEQIIDYENGALVQDAFPNLTSSEREFFMTGITDEEWEEAFREDEEEDLEDTEETSVF